ncbi:FeoA family protein [Desulfosporosinus nitroreducens]|uniref:Ferrous iron transport protein A n=1 Tax=Desulfosporosinus nitroreducens TaxID=2018668 RepID=A0ABT8QN81_9FIRM|nr:FeoA family protein [Desulfosporosinus nitroreducens]MCO1603305.1 ferrous iron transport protein A [Desulfosporosinus nitroreducens]MDO0822710.1 ferrous iron transport protein A [Desulfosporosinus nitroreducens]
MMSLARGKLNTPYTVNRVNTDHEDIREFLFTLGCYPGEKVTIISKLASNYIINIKDARYSIDEDLANAILV